MSDTKRLCLVAGAGPGLGKALLDRFAEGGYHAVGLGRANRSDGIEVRAIDLACPKSVMVVTRELIERYGPPAVAIHNPARLFKGAFIETPLEAFEETWRSMALSAVIFGQAVIPAMVRGGGGAFLVSGATASLRGGADFLGLRVGQIRTSRVDAVACQRGSGSGSVVTVSRLTGSSIRQRAEPCTSAIPGG